jgi:ribosomal protein L11 methyltransferase
MRYNEFTLYVKRETSDIVCAMLYEFPIQGVEIGDEVLTDEEQAQMFVGIFDMDNIPLEEVSIKFYLSEDDDMEQIIKDIKIKLDDLNTRLPLGSLKFESGITDDIDWAHNWKKFYKPFMIGERILIRPIWEDIESIDDIIPEIIIDIDPGMAFGSGTHETTALVVKGLDKYIQGGESLIDLGCGSGILGIVATKLGIKQGLLIDLDQSACKMARENVESNNTSDKLTVIHGDLLENVETTVDIIVANILAEIIISVTPDVTKVLKKDGLFISSGIISEKEAEVASCLVQNGFEIIEVMHDGDWVAFVSKYIG